MTRWRNWCSLCAQSVCVQHTSHVRSSEVVCIHKVRKMLTLCFRCAAIQRQLGQAGHVCLHLLRMEDVRFVFLVCCHSGAAWVCKACACVPGLCEGTCGASIHQLVSGGTLAQDKSCGCQLRSSHPQVLLYGKKLDVPRRMLPS